ncbi:MAG: GntR family transcriptional regulator [bacterium]
MNIKDNTISKYRTLKETKLNKKVYDYLLQEILNGEYPPGTPLPINELAKKLDISNTPIREALRELYSFGILDKAPYKSYKVKKFAIAEIKDIYEARIALESYACKLVVQKNTEEIKDNLNKIHQKGINFYKQKDFNKFQEYNNKFHMLIINYSNNYFIGNMYNRIHKLIHFFSSQIFNITDRPKETLEEHSKIIKNISEGNAGKCSQLMEKHIYNSFSKYKKINERGGGDL